MFCDIFPNRKGTDFEIWWWNERKKTLGLVREQHRTRFLFTFASRIGSGRHKKRSVLSAIVWCYDPLGFVGSTITKAKLILQRMWRAKLQWDESLPQSSETAWSGFCKEVSEVGYGEFARYAMQLGAIVEVHAFCDASLLGRHLHLCDDQLRKAKSGEICAHILESGRHA